MIGLRSQTLNQNNFSGNNNFGEVQNETIGVRRGKGGIFIAQVTIETEFDDYEDDTGLFHKAIDLTIQYEED